MNFYPFHIGDYASATRHLSWDEDAAYRRLLDVYYTSEKALPLELRQVFRLVVASTEDQRAAVESVLSEFFERTEAGWINRRADSEILVMREKQEKQREKANKRWHKPEQERGNAPAIPQHDESYATACDVDAVAMPPIPIPIPTPTPTPIPTTPPKGGDARKRAPTRPDGVSEQIWQDFLAIRKAKRAPLTDTALEGIAREAQKAGLTLAEAIAYCCEQGWQSFNAGWYAERQGGKRPGTGETEWQRSARERMQQFAPGVAAKAPSHQSRNVIDLEMLDVPAIASR
jgi:uncharacterized protein YdaU (DUF1376 family)